jgi:probable F420-dependent oxidoreductase
MRIAVHFGATDQTADPGAVAHEAEIRGFDAIVFPEHTHMPVEHEAAPYSGTDERMVHYRRLHSPFISMAWAAARTTRLKIGTCVSLAAQHDPIVLAKTLASLDALSGGRIVYGFGFGWSEQEMIDHGVDPRRRRATVREKMLAVRAIWTQEQASFSGEFIAFPPSWSWPKPGGGGTRVPIFLGAKGTDKVFDHVIEYCDGWVPSVRGDVEGITADIRRLKARAADAGRDPASVHVDVISPQRSVALFEGYRDAGVERVIIHLPFGDIDEVRRTLDDYARDFLTVFHPG